MSLGVEALLEQAEKGVGTRLDQPPPDETPTPAEDTETPETDQPEEDAPEPEAEPEPDLPEKLRGKTAAEIARMYQELEATLGRQGQTVGDARAAVRQAAEELDAVTTAQLDALAMPAPSEEEIADQTRTLATQRYQQLAPHRNLPTMPDDPANPASWLPEERALWEEVLVTARDKVEAGVLHEQTRALMERSMGSATVQTVVQRQIEQLGIKGVAAERIVAELPPGTTLSALTNPLTRQGTLLAITRLIQAEAFVASQSAPKKPPVVPAQSSAATAAGANPPGVNTQHSRQEVTEAMEAVKARHSHYRNGILDAKAADNPTRVKQLEAQVREIALSDIAEQKRRR